MVNFSIVNLNLLKAGGWEAHRLTDLSGRDCELPNSRVTTMGMFYRHVQIQHFDFAVLPGNNLSELCSKTIDFL